MMRAHVEWIVGVIRAGPEFKDFGDQYEFSCTVLRRGDTCEIIGASVKFIFATYRAVREMLEGQGVTMAVWERSSGKQVAAKGRQ